MLRAPGQGRGYHTVGLGGGGLRWAAGVARNLGFFWVAAGVDVFQNAFST